MIPAKGRHTEYRRLRALHLRTIRRAKEAAVTAKSRLASSLALKKAARGT